MKRVRLLRLALQPKERIATHNRRAVILTPKLQRTPAPIAKRLQPLRLDARSMQGRLGEDTTLRCPSIDRRLEAESVLSTQRAADRTCWSS